MTIPTWTLTDALREAVDDVVTAGDLTSAQRGQLIVAILRLLDRGEFTDPEHIVAGIPAAIAHLDWMTADDAAFLSMEVETNTTVAASYRDERIVRQVARDAGAGDRAIAAAARRRIAEIDAEKAELLEVEREARSRISRYWMQARAGVLV